MTTGRTNSGPKNGGDRPVLGPTAQPLLKRSGLWSDDLPWRRPLLTPGLMWSGDLDWSGAGWGRDTRGRIRRLSWRLSYVWLAALARGDVMDPALLRFRRMLNGDFSRPLEGPKHAQHTLPALTERQKIRASQRARAPLPNRAPSARTREVWIPSQKEATAPPPKWQRAQSQAEVRNRQPLPSPKGSSNTSSANRPAQEGVKVSRQEATPLAKSAQTSPDGSSIQSRPVRKSSSIQSRPVRKSNEREALRPSPDPSSVRTGAQSVSTADERGRPLPPKTAKPTDTKREPHRLKASTPSGAETTQRSDSNISVRSPERFQTALVPQSSTPGGVTASKRTNSTVGRQDQKMVKAGSHRAGHSTVGLSHQPRSWAIAERKTEALPSWRPGATRPGWRLDPWSRESTTPRWQLDPWQPPPWETVGSRPSQSHRATSQVPGAQTSERWTRTAEPVVAEVPKWRQPIRDPGESGSGPTSATLGTAGSGREGTALRSGRKGVPIGVRVGMRPVLLKVPGGVGGTGGPPPSPESVLRAAVQSRDASERVWERATDQPEGLKRRLAASERIRAQRAAERRREREIAKEIVDRLQRVERTKVSTQNTGRRLRPGRKEETARGPLSTARHENRSQTVSPADTRQSSGRPLESGFNDLEGPSRKPQKTPTKTKSVTPERTSGEIDSERSMGPSSPSDSPPAGETASSRRDRTVGEQPRSTATPPTSVRHSQSVPDRWTRRRQETDSRRWTASEESRLVSPTRVMEWGRRDRRGNPAKLRFARMPDLSEWLIDRRPLPEPHPESNDPMVQALQASRIRDPNLPTDLRFSPQWRGRTEASARRYGPVVPNRVEAPRGSPAVGTGRKAGARAQGVKGPARKMVARRMQAAPLRPPATQWMHDREVSLDAPRPSTPSRVRRGPSTPSVDFNSSARERSKQWARDRVRRARTFEQERLERTTQERLAQQTKQQEATKERTTQRRRAREDERRRDADRAIRQQIDSKRRADQGRRSPERPSGPPPLQRPTKQGVGGSGSQTSSRERRAQASHLRTPGGPPPLRPPSALGATPWRGMGSKESPMEWAMAPRAGESAKERVEGRSFQRMPSQSTEYRAASTRMESESTRGRRDNRSRKDPRVSKPVGVDSRANPTNRASGRPSQPVGEPGMPWVKSSDSGHSIFSDRRLIEGWRSPQMSGPRLGKSFTIGGFGRRAEGDQLGRRFGRLSQSQGRSSSSVGPGLVGSQAHDRLGTNRDENRLLQEPWRASTAAESLDAPEGYPRSEPESTTGQPSSASRQWKRSSPRPTGRARRGPTRRSSGRGYYRQDQTGHEGSDEAGAKGQNLGPQKGAPQKTSWRAPVSVRSALAQNTKDAEPPRRPVESTESSLESLTEREMMTVLRTLATNSPEARSLLKEVRRQVAEHRYLWKLRQY